jgi:hypothetical protein
MRRSVYPALFVLVLSACGSSDDPTGGPADGGGAGTASKGGNGSGGKSSGGPGNSSGSGGSTNEGGSGNDGGSPDPGEPYTPDYGRFGEAEHTFTLPFPENGALYHPDLVSDFPQVDFDTLDRLYIPAGEYKTILLGGLPERDADHPLVITNVDGQVKVGGQAANYVFSIRGGKNWILTGRYDPVSKTGDEGFRGHAEGRFAHSRGTYGIFIDDAFSKDGLSGLAIGGGASDFELDCIEITRAEFAGIIVKTDNDGDATMRNVKIHDLYVHDVGSEGIYLGSTQAQPQHSFEGLRIYDNRFLRTGTEALQVGQLGDDCEIHHNVLGPGAIRWRSAFQKYQDGNVQYGQRYGSSSFHHNIVIGTGDLFVEFFPTLVEGDPRDPSDTVRFEDNYFSDTSSSGVYTHSVSTDVIIRFERNSFRGFTFDYDEVYPDASEPVQVFGIGANPPNLHILKDNVYDAPFPFVLWSFPENVTLENNDEGTVEKVRFADFMGDAIDESYRKLEWWTPTATLHPDQPSVVYEPGDFVVHQGVLYQALEQNSGKEPSAHPEIWKALPPPADDVRLAPNSPHSGLGVRWPPPSN